MIKLTNLDKIFNKGKLNEIHVINHTTLEFPETGLVALTGPSGCGKTTLLNVIGGLDKVDSGEVTFDQKTLKGYRSAEWDVVRNQYIGYIFQNYNLITDKTVYENVEIALNMAGLYDKDEIEERINYVLNSVGMYNYRKRNVLALSGGQQQRVAIARAIAKNPKVVLADEPTGNLDANNTFEVMSIIKKISQTCLVILVTHEKELVDFYADRVIQLSDGLIINDYENQGNRTLEHVDDRNIYLKDLAQAKTDEPLPLEFYYKDEIVDKPAVKMVYQNNTLYVQVDSKLKVKYITNESEIKLLNEHYKKPETVDASKYSFDLNQFNEIKQTSRKSFIRFQDTLKTGFKKVFGKRKFFGKLFLLAYFAISGLIVFNLATFGNLTKVDESDFLTTSKNLISVEKPTDFDMDDAETILALSAVEAYSPYYQFVTSNAIYQDLYQGSKAMFYGAYVQMFPEKASNVDPLLLTSGVMPDSKEKVVVDEWIADKILEQKSVSDLGVTDYESLLGTYFQNYGFDYNLQIVGVIRTESPIVVLTDDSYMYFNTNSGSLFATTGLFQGNYTLVSGDEPVLDDEVIVHELTGLELNSTVSISGMDFKVVGTYSSDKVTKNLISVSGHEKIITKLMISSNIEKNIYFFANDVESAIQQITDAGFKAVSLYSQAKTEYLTNQRNQIASQVQTILITVAGIVVYIFFMMRSSMLNRIREIGIYRSIGASKRDIYKIFFSEILAFTTVGSLSGYLFMTYLINQVQKALGDFTSVFYLPWTLFALGIGLIYTVNIIFGMLPIFSLLRKTPSEINAKYDI